MLHDALPQDFPVLYLRVWTAPLALPGSMRGRIVFGCGWGLAVFVEMRGEHRAAHQHPTWHRSPTPTAGAGLAASLEVDQTQLNRLFLNLVRAH